MAGTTVTGEGGETVFEPIIMGDLSLPPPIGPVMLELMGRRQMHGYLSEEGIAGARFLKLDVPVDGPDGGTHYFSVGAVYAIHPMSEEAMLAVLRPAPPIELCQTVFDSENGDGHTDICNLEAGHDGPHDNDLPF